MKNTLISGRIRSLPGSRLIAMPLPYQVMRLFISPKGHLVEVKFLDPPADTPEPAREWLWVTDQSVTTLWPRLSDDETRQVRVFREAHLQLDDRRAEFALPNGELLTLTASPVPTLPALQHQLIHNHLS